MSALKRLVSYIRATADLNTIEAKMAQSSVDRRVTVSFKSPFGKFLDKEVTSVKRKTNKCCRLQGTTIITVFIGV